MEKPEWSLHDMYAPEQDLFDSVTSEFNDIAGFPIKYYIKIATDELDHIYGEDPTSEYSEGYDTKVVYEPQEEIATIDIFGYVPTEIIQYCYMTKSVFKRDVGDFLPKVGDVIVTLWNNRKYEISNVSDDQTVFLAKKMVWGFVLQPYKFSEDSQSAKDIVYDIFSDDVFPDINNPLFGTDALSGHGSKPLSAYGENDLIEELSDEIDTNPDSAIYGY